MMMKVKTKLNVSAEFLYQRLIQTALDDLSQELGYQAAASELAGAKYQAGNEEYKAAVTVLAAEQNQSYHYMVELAQGQLMRSYDLKKLGANQVELVYQSQLVAKNWLAKFELAISDFFLGWLKSYNYKKLLKQLELSYSL